MKQTLTQISFNIVFVRIISQIQIISWTKPLGRHRTKGAIYWVMVYYTQGKI